jgi:1-aminocyclopropane-1-carboxylate deaminase/D-cysteine desulfhydrase-like pyridoxal-dependent ACC family enzyme
MGATVHVAPTADRADRARLVDQVTGDLRASGWVPYPIGVGGSSALGALGQVRAARELLSQATQNGIGIDVIVLPSATGGTQAGILAAVHDASWRSETPAVDGIAVAQPAAELRAAIDSLLTGLRSWVPGADGAGPVEVDPAQLGAGYGVRSAAADEASALLARTEGILVDPIYTAKALAGLVAGVRSGAWDGKRIVFWHAGGLPGMFEALDAPG